MSLRGSIVATPVNSDEPTRLVDLSHTVEDGMITYKGPPAPIVCDYLSRAGSRSHYVPGTEFHIGRIDMVANTGTYVDSPFHRYADGKDLSQLALESLANLDYVVIRATESRGTRNRPRAGWRCATRKGGVVSHRLGRALAN